MFVTVKPAALGALTEVKTSDLFSSPSPKSLDFPQFACVWGVLGSGAMFSACSCISRTAQEPLEFPDSICGISEWETAKEVFLVF